MEHEPVPRSQAKRILSQCESFKEVILDFEKVQYMSQGFPMRCSVYSLMHIRISN